MTDNIAQPVWAPDGSLAMGQPDPELLCPDCGANVAEEDHEPECSVVPDDHDTDAEERGEAPMVGEGDAEESDRLDAMEAEEDDYSDILTEQEIRDGGAYRKDDTGAKFWLDKAQLAEFTRMDETFTEDKDFWDWWRSFKDANKLKAASPAPSKKQKRGLTSPQWNDYWDGGQQPKKKYLSDWWGGSHYYHYGGASSKVKKLAVAQQAVQSTIRVIDNNVKRMRVMFTQAEGEAGSAPQSFTAYNERLVSISPKAILDDTLSEGDGIDITTGFALHEASHVEYSEPSLVALSKPTLLEPISVAGLLHNLFEDVRIEQLTSREFPGFAGYFDRALEYMWPWVKENAPDEWGPELKAKLSAIIAGVKWPDQYQPQCDANVVLATEMQWWKDLRDAYAGGHFDMRTVLEMGMTRLREDEDTRKEMDEQTKQEHDAQATGSMAMPFSSLPQAVQEAVKKLMEGGGLIMVCPSPTSGAGAAAAKEEMKGREAAKEAIAEGLAISSEDGRLVDELTRSQMELLKARELKIPEMGNKSPEFMILTPQETMDSKANWTPPLRGLVSRMRNAFFFRPVAQQWTSRQMRSGSIDDDMLWSAAPILGKDRDYRVFEQKMIESSPDTTITLLIDISGSMYGEKMQVGVQASALMHEVLKATPGVRVRVRAHTGDCSPGDRGQAIIYKVWEGGEPIARLGIPETVDHGNNYDGYAIGWCVREMLNNAKPEEQRLIIVLSDGLPHGQGYGGDEAMAHVRETQLWARRQGVDVIQIAIDPYMDPARQAQMFDHFVPFTSLEALPAQITAILKKAIK